MIASCNEASDVSHVHHEVSTNFMSDFRETLEINRARVGRSTRNNDLRALLLRLLLERIVVNCLGLRVNAIGTDFVELAREIDRAAVREMTAVVEAHSQDFIARLDERKVGRKVGIRARMWLHICEVCIEKLACAVARDVLDDVDVHAAAVVPLPRVTLGIFIRANASHRLHDRAGREILRSNELDTIALATELGANCVVNVSISVL